MQKIWNFFGLALLSSLMFFLGYRLAVVDNYNLLQNNVTTKATNGFIQNSLTGISTRPIFGILEGQKKTYGTLWLKEIDDGEKIKTEIRLQIDNIPLKMTKPSTQEIRDTPQNFDLLIPKKCCGGLDFDYGPKLGDVRVQIQGGSGSVDFSYVFEAKLIRSEYDKVVLNSELANFFQVIKEDTRDWPKMATEKPAPYFWANL